MPLNGAELRGRTVAAADGKVGAFVDFLFDPTTWAARAIIVLNSAAESRRVALLAPMNLVRGGLRAAPLRLDRRLAEIADQDADQAFRPGIACEAPAIETQEALLLGAREVTGYGVEATDGLVGTVEGLVVDELTWHLTRIEVDGRRWWPGRRLWIGPAAIAAVHQSRRMLRLTVSRTSLVTLGLPCVEARGTRRTI